LQRLCNSEEAARQVVGRDSGFCIEPHIACCAAIPRRKKHSRHHPTTALSGSRSGDFWIFQTLKMGPQGTRFSINENIKWNAAAQLRKIPKRSLPLRPPLWSSGQSSWLQIRRPGFDSRHYQKKKVVGLERGPLSLVSTTEKLLDRKVAAPV
jgi:hypothetical protein